MTALAAAAFLPALTTTSSTTMDSASNNLIRIPRDVSDTFDLQGPAKLRICAKGDAICIPANYSKFDLPNETLTTVNVGIDIKDIPKIDDKEFSITLNAFFVVRWQDERMIIDQVFAIFHFITQPYLQASILERQLIPE